MNEPLLAKTFGGMKSPMQFKGITQTILLLGGIGETTGN